MCQVEEDHSITIRLKFDRESEECMGKLKCPECGSELELTVDVVGTDCRKICNNGNLHKVINRCTAKPLANAASYLRCSNRCGFTYDTEHANDESIKELDNWISQHLEDISKWD